MYQTVTLTGTYQLPDGSPAKGPVDIIPSEKVIIDSTRDVILSGRVKVQLDETGSFSVALPATDDPTLNPTGFGYTVSAKLNHQTIPAVSFPLPAALGTVDIADVTTVDPSTFVADANYVTPAELDAAVAGVVVDTSGLEAEIATKADADEVATALGAKQDAGTIDTDVATLAGDPASETGQVLAATFARGLSLREPRFGVVGDGVANDTAAVQAALDAATAAGTWLYAPPGAYRVAGIVLADNATIIGAGSELTTFMLPNGGSGEVFISQGFAGLTGGGSDAGVSGVSLVGFTIHGNRAADTAGTWGLRKFGYRWRLRDIIVRDCGGGGIYSEWGHEPGAGDDGDFMEDLLSEVRVHECNGMGVQWRGPHDSRFEQVLIYANQGIGLSVEGGTNYHAGGIILDSVHVYGNLSHGVQVISSTSQGASINAATLISESNTGTGLVIGSNGALVSSGSFYNNGGGGVVVQSNAAGYAIHALLQNNTGAQVAFTADGGDGLIEAICYTALAAQATLSGSKHPSTQLVLVATGVGTNTNRAAFPGEVQVGNGLTVSGAAYYADTATIRLPRTASTNTGYLWYDATTGMLAFRDGVANATRQVAYRDTASTTRLGSSTDSINTGGKFAGKQVFNTSTNRPVWATGSTATSTWVYADGTVAHTPA